MFLSHKIHIPGSKPIIVYLEGLRVGINIHVIMDASYFGEQKGGF
jgi:hypothetical protein